MAFVIFFEGIVYSSYTLRESLLDEIGVGAEFFAIILSGLTILAGFATSLQSIIHKKLRNKALAFISIIYMFSYIIIGIVSLCNLSWGVLLTILILLYGVQYALQAPYYTLNSKYLKSFATPNMRVKISTTFDLVKSISSFVIAMFCSSLLKSLTPQLSFLIIGVIFTIILIVVLVWMKDKFGLKPEEYSSKDIQKVREEIEQ